MKIFCNLIPYTGSAVLFCFIFIKVKKCSSIRNLLIIPDFVELFTDRNMRQSKPNKWYPPVNKNVSICVLRYGQQRAETTIHILSMSPVFCFFRFWPICPLAATQDTNCTTPLLFVHLERTHKSSPWLYLCSLLNNFFLVSS